MNCSECPFCDNKGECEIPSYFKGIKEICLNPKGDKRYAEIKAKLEKSDWVHATLRWLGGCYDNQTKNVIWQFSGQKILLRWT